MSAYLLVVALFACWGLIGVALLALVRADTRELRIVLVAPTLGTCITVIAVFLFSEAGVPVRRCAVPIAIALLVVSAVILAIRRPPLHPGAIAVGVVCVAGLSLSAWPLFSLGFSWLGNGNDDMANYVLSAQDLLQHGLLASVDFRGLLQGRDYATVLTSMHLAGSRPGADLLLAFVSRVAARPPYETFMPVILAFNLCGASAVGALAMQVARRWWAGALAAGLLLVSPLATYGVVQQLFAQVWGLGLVAALFALLMRPELHSGKGARLRDVIPIGLLTTGLFLGYVELVPEMGLAYVAYVAVLGVRRRLGRAALTRLWLPGVLVVLVILNGYFFTEISFLRGQVTHGVSAGSFPPLFGYILVPSALPGVVGLQTLPPTTTAPLLDATIVLAAVVLVGAILGCLASARRGVAAAYVLLVNAALAALLAYKGSDFGLFKLTMYIQPFLAAIVAIWVARARRTWTYLAVAVLLGVLVAAQVSTQHAYVKSSQNPEDVPNLSAPDVIPAFHSAALTGHGPFVAVTENPVLIKLEAAAAVGHAVFFQSRDVFTPFLREYDTDVSGAKLAQAKRASGKLWVSRSFRLLNAGGGTDAFAESTGATRSLTEAGCTLSLPGPSEVPFNRYAYPTSTPNLVTTPCDAPRDVLAFTSSTLGQSFYLPLTRESISFFQPQADSFFTGRTMAGFGRYAMFQVLGYAPGARLVIELTATLNHDGANLLPPVALVGAARQPLPLLGRGSARVFSSPVKPQMIAGIPYVLVDMGVDGRLPGVTRSGLQGLYGKSVPTDPDFLTAYVRDISLVGSSQYAKLKPPTSLSAFPRDLENSSLEYSGLYEDGWMGQDADVRLAAGPKTDLVVRGEVPLGAGSRLQLLVDSRPIASIAIAPGPLNVRVALPASLRSRLIGLRFAKTIKLGAPDLRPAAAHLSFLGLVPPAPAR